MQSIRRTYDGERSDPVWHTGLWRWCAVLVIAVSLVGRACREMEVHLNA